MCSSLGSYRWVVPLTQNTVDAGTGAYDTGRLGGNAWKTYHDVMEEKLPGMTQLLVQHHVKEVVDEVTCGRTERKCPFLRQLIDWTEIKHWTWAVMDKLSVSWGLGVGGSGGGVGWGTLLPWRQRWQPRCVLERGYSYPAPAPNPFPLPAVSMATAFQNTGKIMKRWGWGWRVWGSFGVAGINPIMLEIWHQRWCGGMFSQV